MNRAHLNIIKENLQLGHPFDRDKLEFRNSKQGELLNKSIHHINQTTTTSNQIKQQKK